MIKSKSLISWYGGKHKMVKYINCFIPFNKINTYVEVFGGGGHVLINKPFSPIEVYNDINKGLYSIFRCLNDVEKTKILIEKLLKTDYNEDEFLYAYNNWDKVQDEIEMAKLTFILSTQSFNSSCCHWNRPCSPKDLEQYHRKIISILDFVPRFKNVIVENMTFEEIIKKYDDINTFFYMDPPYVPSTRTTKDVYKYEMKDELHEKMVDILMNIRGKALVSGYDNPIYNRISDGNWSKVSLGRFSKSSQKTKKGGYKQFGEEFLWMNYKI